MLKFCFKIILIKIKIISKIEQICFTWPGSHGSGSGAGADLFFILAPEPKIQTSNTKCNYPDLRGISKAAHVVLLKEGVMSLEKKIYFFNIPH